MSMDLSTNIAIKAIEMILVLPVAMVLDGIFRKLLAKMQNRVGPPIIQPFYDVIKLFQKGKSDSKGNQNIFFKLVPLLYFISTYGLFLFVLGIIHFPFDFILFIYIIILSSAMYILLGLVSNSPFGAMGSMRDMLLMVSYEIVLTICIFSFVVYSHALSLNQVTGSWLFLRLPLASLCMFVVALVETRITPFDTAEAEPEIMGSVESEYSGRGLAFIEMSKYMRLLFFIVMLTRLLFNPSGSVLFILSFILVSFILVFSEATTARYRTDQTFRLLIMVLIVSVIEFIRLYLAVR